MRKNQLKLQAFLYLSLGFFLMIFSCRKKDKCGELPVTDSYFTFNLIDQYGINQIAAWGSRYDSDSVYLVKMDGTLPNQLEINGGGRIGFSVPDNYEEAIDTFVTRQFLLYLPDIHGYPRKDVDTIKFRYLFSKVCYYDTFQVFYNDSLYHDGKYLDFISFIKK